jgi:hypothetical protein
MSHAAMMGTSFASGRAVAVGSVCADGGSAGPPLSYELVNGSLGPFEFEFFRSLFDLDERKRGGMLAPAPVSLLRMITLMCCRRFPL